MTLLTSTDELAPSIQQRLKNILPRLESFLSKRVIFAYLFGSVLTDYFRKESDVDLALYFGKALGPDEYWTFLYELHLSMDNELEFDVVILDDAAPVIATQVLNKGRLIVDRDKNTRVLFTVRKLSEYHDLKMNQRILEQRLIEG